MSKAKDGHIIPYEPVAITRRSMLLAGATLAAGGASAIRSNAALAADESFGWPEFRPWYELMLEEEALFGAGNTIGERGTHDDARHTAIFDQMTELRSAMYARPATAPVHEAILSVLGLHAAERSVECHDAKGQFRFLTLGAWDVHDREDFELRVGMRLIEKTIRMAVSQNLLPGVAVYGKGGNA